MKIVGIFGLISLLFLLNSSLSTKVNLHSPGNEQNLSSSICKITKDIVKSKIDTVDILIGNLGGQAWSSTINGISKCINDENVVVVSDFGTKITEISLRKAPVIILFLDDAKTELLLTHINDHQGSTVWHHMVKLLCIIPNFVDSNQRLSILDILTDHGFLDVAIVQQQLNGDITYDIYRSMKLHVQLINPKCSASVFPDKLKDLKGHEYKVPVYRQQPLVIISKDQEVMTPMVHFLQAVGSIQNARFKLIILDGMQDFYDSWARREMDLSFNTLLDFTMTEPKLLNYEKKSFCALVPVPPKIPLYYVIYVKPFNGCVWFLFGLSIASSVAVWRMYRGRGAVNSHWQLAAGIFMMFIGQGAGFSRKNRFVLAMLLNVICLSVFLLSTLYGSIITSFMIEPAHENRLKSVDDLLASDYKILYNHAFEYSIRNSSLIDSLASKMIPEKFIASSDNRIIEQRYVFIRTCHKAKVLLSEILPNDRPVTDHYYLLPEELSWSHVQLEASYLNPFLERLQYYMDLSFQAGLPQMWNVFVSQDYSNYENIQANDDKKLLELNDLLPVFAVWFIGCCLSGIVLVLEIFCHDCLSKLNLKKSIALMFYRMVNRVFKSKNIHKPKVRKIFVRPYQNNCN